MKDYPKITPRIRNGKTDYCIDSGIIDGKRRREFKPTMTEAKERADAIRRDRAKYGDLSMLLTAKQRIEASRAFETLGDTPLMTAVTFYMENNKAMSVDRPTLGKMYLQYMAGAEARGLRGTSLQSMKAYLAKFVNGNFNYLVDDIKEWHVSNFIKGNAGDNTITKLNYIRYLQGFFNYCVKHGVIVKNPVDLIEKPRCTKQEVRFLSVDDVQKIIHAAPDNIKFKLAIGFFAGLRTAELDRLTWDNIGLDTHLITVNADISKTGVTRHVEISRNLLSILMCKPMMSHDSLGLSNGSFAEARRKLCKTLDIPDWPDNAMRHSFATYHLAMNENANKTAFELGHTSGISLLYRHYRGLTTKTEAEKYWEII